MGEKEGGKRKGMIGRGKEERRIREREGGEEEREG